MIGNEGSCVVSGRWQLPNGSHLMIFQHFRCTHSRATSVSQALVRVVRRVYDEHDHVTTHRGGVGPVSNSNQLQLLIVYS